MAELSFSIRVVRSLAAAMKRKRCQVTALHSPRLVVIRLIRVIRGLNILSFQLQNHSTSLMPIRVIEATERIARKKAECARRSVSFISAYSNACTGSIQIRDNPCSPFHPCSTSTHDHCVNGLTQNSPCQTLPTRVSVRSSLMFAVVHFMHPTNHCFAGRVHAVHHEIDHASTRSLAI